MKNNTNTVNPLENVPAKDMGKIIDGIRYVSEAEAAELERRRLANDEAMNKRNAAVNAVISKYYKDVFEAISSPKDERYEQCLAEVKALNVEENYPLPYPCK